MRRRSGLLGLLAALLLSGCWSRIEVTDLGVVAGLAVDRGETKPVRVTLYLSRSPGTEETAQQKAQWVIAREGENIPDAFRHISMASARRITLHHLRVVLIGEEYAGDGMGELLDFLIRSPQVRLITRVMLVKGKAQEVLETPSQLEALQPENLAEIIQAKGGPEPRLKELIVGRSADTHSPWIYAVRIIDRPAKTPGTVDRGVEIAGIALLRGDRVVEVLEPDLAQAMLWLEGDPKEAMISTGCPEAPEKLLAARVEDGNTRIVPRLSGSKLSFQVQVQGRADIINTECGKGVMDPATREKLEQALEGRVEARLEAAVAAFQAAGTDPAGFGKRLQLGYTNYWRGISERWPEVWPGVPVTVSASISVDRSGLLLDPANRTRQELKEE